ncbi:TPA: hypothetical protein NGJ40_002952 [Legionella pneumophila]|nr:hypothetical protein [Legionella pneumophila]
MFLFQNPNTTNSIWIVLIVVVLIAAAASSEELIPRVVLGIVRVLGRTPVVASNTKGVLISHKAPCGDVILLPLKKAVPLRFKIKTCSLLNAVTLRTPALTGWPFSSR